MNETPLHFKTITELGSLIKSKEISPVELTETMLTRIQEQDSQYKSYATVMSEQAKAESTEGEGRVSVLKRQEGAPVHLG